MAESPTRSMSLEAFRALAAANGLQVGDAELAEIHAAHGVLAALLARLDAPTIAAGYDWSLSIVEAWER